MADGDVVRVGYNNGGQSTTRFATQTKNPARVPMVSRQRRSKGRVWLPMRSSGPPPVRGADCAA